VKSDDYYQNVMLPWEQRYTSDAYLRSVSLGQLGADIEFTIHNNMHMRWASQPAVGIRPNGSLLATINPRWDVPEYNYLGDTYSSHVHPTFWKLHGWVDDRIEDWKRANGVVGEISWKGTWLGPHGHLHAPHVKGTPDPQRLVKLESIAALLEASGVFDGGFAHDT
jgi:hypothetical protein